MSGPLLLSVGSTVAIVHRIGGLGPVAADAYAFSPDQAQPKGDGYATSQMHAGGHTECRGVAISRRFVGACHHSVRHRGGE